MKRLVLCLVMLAAFAAPVGAVTYSPWVVLRPKMNLAANAADSLTPPIRIFGAQQAFFYLRSAAADTDSLSSVNVQLSNDGLNWVNATVAGVASVSISQVPSAGAVNTLGKTGRFHVLSGASAQAPFIPWGWARLRFTNGAAQIDSFSVDACTVSHGSLSDLVRQPATK